MKSIIEPTPINILLVSVLGFIWIRSSARKAAEKVVDDNLKATFGSTKDNQS